MALFFAAAVLTYFIPHASSQCLHTSHMNCGSQAKNLGTHSSIESCALATSLDSECGDYFMFSQSHKSWGCRCCSPDKGEEGGSSHSHWDLYNIEGCGFTREPTAKPTPVPTKNECFDYERGSCWDLGFVDWKWSADECKRYCTLLPECNYWSYHPLRANRRCHLCSHDGDSSNCDEPGSCIFGPSQCDGEEAADATTILQDALGIAQSYCEDEDVSPDDMYLAASDMQELLSNRDIFFESDDVFTSAADTAASIMTTECIANAHSNPCDFAGVLLLHVRGLLLLADGNSNRAFPDDSDARKEIWDDYRVLIADHGFFNDLSLEAIRMFFADLPTHLLTDGVLFDSPFGMIQTKSGFKCDSDDRSVDLKFTNRGFNVFQNQVGQRTENAFPSDADPVRGDLLMTVLRHEAAHQFDRVVKANDRLNAYFALLKAASQSEGDYMRVTSSFFAEAPQEIIASHVGNQYFLDTAAQFRLAMARFEFTKLPLSWMMLFFDIIGGADSSTTTFYLEVSSVTGETETIRAQLARDVDGRIIGLLVPGCNAFTFSYDAVSGLVDSYSGPADCLPDFSTSHPATTSPEKNTNTAELVFDGLGCLSQGANLGIGFSEPIECLLAAKTESKCTGNEVMWSDSYANAWGCRCCQLGTSYTRNSNWDIYQLSS